MTGGRKRLLSVHVAVIAALAALSAHADTPMPGVGAIQGVSAPSIEGGAVLTYQRASDRRMGDETAGSADLVATLPFRTGTLTLHLEGATSPRPGGVTEQVPDANSDVGSTLNRHGDGRFQVSEFHYEFTLGATWVVAGLIDPAGYLDASEVANDEATQFLNATLVNNPSIELPDYVPGVAVYADSRGSRPGYTLLLTGSHGLADNPERSYRELVRLDAEGKGLFGAAEIHWQWGDFAPRLGVWTHTAPHERLDGQPGSEPNRGAYALLDGVSGDSRWNLRVGVADPRVSEAAWFAGAALERPVGPASVGLGVTHTAHSRDARAKSGESLGSSSQAELYARLDLGTHWQLTPSLQYVRNPGFERSGHEVGRELWILGARLTAAF